MQKFTLERPAFDLRCHGLRQISFRDGANHSRRLTRWLNQVADQNVDALDGICPGVGHLAKRRPLTDPALFANYAHHAFQFPSHALVGFDHRIERVGNLSRHTCPIVRQSRRKIAALERHQSRK